MDKEKKTGLEFYNLLFEDEGFTMEMGRVTLAAGRLEAELMQFLKRKGIKRNVTSKTLGQLIYIGKDKGVIDNDVLKTLELVLKQRNYLTHNIYSLFNELIDEPDIVKGDLLLDDVTVYTDRAFVLRNNLNDIADMLTG
ncbi:hypothetical protein [Sunxiuqinia rutila]|uniref:hypothetical protein n=1 Tax=Sunxiuqinia rutila TaxID=1397841 RepID=UPI003D360272